MKRYQPANVEPKWREKWLNENLYLTDNSSEKPKKYILDMFPYPSGDGLHVGHVKGYTATDILSRYYRAQGFNVLHPMGWDAFGLPAENYALKVGVHPTVSTAKNIANIKRQMQMVGLSYDWSREINTTDPSYYRFTQWIFIKLFEHGLAYEAEAPINWCPSCKTGLANEEVLAGECERCGTQVEQKEIRQWVLKITQYADRLIEGLEGLDWPQSIKDMQVNWIGRSGGAVIKFDGIDVFTTRPDTIFGATFVVISPEHPLLTELANSKLEEVMDYIKKARIKSELERKENKEKTGVFTGIFVKNPLSGEDVPVWVADYVLMSYGTGAIMGVPAHDQRDFEFAKKYDLPIKEVVVSVRGPAGSVSRRPSSPSTSLRVRARRQEPSSPSPLTEAYEGEGVLVSSGDFTGLESAEAREKISEYIERHQLGSKHIQYHIRDWVFSRQRYWGEPIPLVHCKRCGVVAVPEEDLPVKLPEVEKYQPTGTGESPLAAMEEWVNTVCPKCKGPAKRETNTMPQWAGSCWYYLRFCDPGNDKEFVSPDVERYWMPVDWYVGGAEHAVLHLLYARFWHNFLYDIKAISTKEPFYKLTNVGLVLAPDGRKMSKRWGNIVTPDEVVKEFGADTLRVYEAFMGPFENAISWDPGSIYGVFRFLNRVWELIQKSSGNADDGIERFLTRTMKKVQEDIEQMKFNTAVAAMMEFLNVASRKSLTVDQKKRFLKILSPFAPYMTEELWSRFAPEGASRDEQKWSIHQQSWPKFDSKYLEEEQVVVVVQVNGRVRDQIAIDQQDIANEELVKQKALESSKVQKYIDGKQVTKSIYVPGKILNLVVTEK